ncbi:hypothetical protein [uncultured Tenacibaculum sp.]|uniref:hypothetical protein n=1 Tax=uncultured Tenacibaculum sp. TaxID=174713 RepID=UPI00261C29A1|nr:hypothetical protein [uncultured Tenacibaculum sp.]
MKNYILFLLLSIIISCNSQKTNKDIIVIVQPKMEKGQTNSITILFKNLDKKDSIFVPKIEELELNDNPYIEKKVINGEEYLSYYNYIIPQKTGNFILSGIKGFSRDKVLTANSMNIEVVNKMPKVTHKDIVLKLVSDKQKYAKKDTINFALYEYSKYYTVNKVTTKRDSLISLPKLKNKESSIQIEKESDLYKISGIESLESQLEHNFEVIDFDYDPFREGSIMEVLNNELYIKTLLISFKMLAKNKGKFTIAPSQFIYLISKSNSDYLGSLTTNNSKNDKINMSNKIQIKSNELSFLVK